ncbi:uncharacterized protein V6R79_002804 [Siganus canaliculatus]
MANSTPTPITTQCKPVENRANVSDLFRLSEPLFWVFIVFGLVLLLSLSLNIFFCLSGCCSGKEKSNRRKRQRQSVRQMEENPIYGNLTCMDTSLALYTEADATHSRDQQRDGHNSQSISQDCYANLTLKAPRVQSGASSPQIQYSDAVELEELPHPEKEEEAHPDTADTLSDLYASVQTQRTKTIHTSADDGEGYANHL